MSSYDRWLEAPATAQPEPVECPDCDGSGTILVGWQSPMGYRETRERCSQCDGDGYIDLSELEEEPDDDRMKGDL